MVREFLSRQIFYKNGAQPLNIMLVLGGIIIVGLMVKPWLKERRSSGKISRLLPARK